MADTEGAKIADAHKMWLESDARAAFKAGRQGSQIWLTKSKEVWIWCVFQPVVVPAGSEQTRARGNALMSNKHGNNKPVAKNAVRTAW